MLPNPRVRLFTLALMVGAGPAALAAPDFWDPRLDDICQLDLIDVAALVTPSSGYWRLSEARFENEVEAGGTHHIYVKCLNASGSPITGQRFFQVWPHGNTTVDEAYCDDPDGSPNWTCADTKGGGIDDYWGNAAMSGGNCPAGNCGWPYSALVSETTSPAGLIGLSDKVIGMGLHNPQGTPCNAHVSFRLLYRWTIATPAEPQIARSPASFNHTITQGTNPANDVFNVWNAGGGTLNYSINDNAGWMSQVPPAGSSTGGSTPITIQYATASLGLGPHNGTITISGNAPNSPQTLDVSVTVEAPTVPGDFDGDVDVDLVDFGHLQACFTGAGICPIPAGCEDADLEGDCDVDQNDFAIFQGCMSGANIPADPDCAG
jgi:hypothetical protein